MRVFSFGGGVQSTAALVLAAEGKIDFSTFVFANVGEQAENPDTLVYIKEFAEVYAREHGIEFKEVQRTRSATGELRDLYDDLVNGSGRTIDIPVRMSNGAPGNRNCTENYKIRVIARILPKGEINVLGMGISLDEFHRMRADDPKFPHIHKEYPLIDLRLDRAQCAQIIERAGLPIPPKSSCWFCPFKRTNQWRTLQREHPDLFDKSVELERALNKRRAALGKDDIFLSSALKPLDKVFGDTRQSTFEDVEEEGTCTTDYCFT